MRISVLTATALLAANSFAADSKFAEEFGRRWTRTRPLAIGVAQAMPPVQYAFRPDPGSMSFGEQVEHVAQSNFAFCAGLKDTAAPLAPSPKEKDALVKYLTDSFDYCSTAIASVTPEQMDRPHSSPDGRLNGRELLLAMYVHVAHHRGQQEVYLRIKGIAPPQYVF
ncbi:MAG TPA: DinB family protein [Bryobacteraceae bacterium]|jgi:uncharacterized damage-inducible protein DinB|nr:DinB family protein [Bryobacteraceae bacterium]